MNPDPESRRVEIDTVQSELRLAARGWRATGLAFAAVGVWLLVAAWLASRSHGRAPAFVAMAAVGVLYVVLGSGLVAKASRIAGVPPKALLKRMAVVGASSGALLGVAVAFWDLAVS